MISDFRSDTVTRPSQAMRRVIAEAEVGDHLLGDDPTAARLEEVTARLLGKERALYFPSGTMANQVAIQLHSRPGSEGLVLPGAHVLHYEEGAAAAWAGVHLREIGEEPGVIDVEAWRKALAPRSVYQPEVSIACFENTHNMSGGKVLDFQDFQTVTGVARERGIPVHLDGARLANAAVRSGRPLPEWAEQADTVMMCLSKGLGAPVGSLLAGTEDAMDRAWRLRRRMGGAMRQAGILAAAGLYALEHNFEGLAHDHERAKRLAAAVTNIPGFTVTPPDTNIVMIDVDESLGEIAALISRLLEEGVALTQVGERRLRAVTHLDVGDTDVDQFIAAFEAVSGRQRGGSARVA